MGNERIGVLIGATFGLVFVVVNAGSLPVGVALALRTVAVLALVGLVAYLFTRPALPSTADRTSRAAGMGFTHGYWWVIIVEVVAMFAGLRVIGGVFDAPEANVAWIALVVGVHFAALAMV